MPIHFLHQSVPFDELIALYAASDVCLVASTRDGMNLVSYEYIACQNERHGVLMLSEFAGAAQSLNGSVVFNPWNTEELANCLHDAVTMSEEQRTVNFEKLYKYIHIYTSAKWGKSFVKELTKISNHAMKVKARRQSMAIAPDNGPADEAAAVGETIGNGSTGSAPTEHGNTGNGSTELAADGKTP